MTWDVTWYDMHPNQTKIKQINMMYSMQHFIGEKSEEKYSYYVLTNESCYVMLSLGNKLYSCYSNTCTYTRTFTPSPGPCPGPHPLPLSTYTHHSSSFWNVQMKKMAKIPAPTFTAHTHRRGEAEGEIGRETDIEHFYTMFFIRHAYC